MCKVRHKVCNGQIYPLKIKFQAFTILYFHFRLSKTYSFNPSIKNTLGLNVFENFGRETKFNLKNLNSILNNQLALRFIWQNEP